MIQAEHREWLFRMFPDQKPSLPAALMLEEAGELVQALAKLSQEEVYGKEPRYVSTDWRGKLEDAVGDCAISACSLCNANGWDFDSLLSAPVTPSVVDDPLYIAVDVVQAAVCAVIDPRDSSVVVQYLSYLRKLCRSTELDFEGCILSTWDQVKRRTR